MNLSQIPRKKTLLPTSKYLRLVSFVFKTWLCPCSQRWRNSIQSGKSRAGADCGSEHELLIAKFRLQLKRVGKTTRPFRCDLNQIPYDYTVEVTHRFKGLDLIECPKICGQRFVTLYRRQWSKPSPTKQSQSHSCVQIFVIPWTVACHAPLSIGFPRQEYWSGLPFLLQVIFPSWGFNPHFLRLLHWQALVSPGKSQSPRKEKQKSKMVAWGDLTNS